MKVIVVFIVLVCVCGGCKGKGVAVNGGNAMQKEIEENGKIASGAIINDALLPETGAQQPQDLKETKLLQPGDSKQPGELVPKKPVK